MINEIKDENPDCPAEIILSVTTVKSDVDQVTMNLNSCTYPTNIGNDFAITYKFTLSTKENAKATATQEFDLAIQKSNSL